MSTPIAPTAGPAPGQTHTWSQVWLYALTRPSETTYAILASDPAATATRGLIWVGVTSLITSLAVIVFRVLLGPNMEVMTRELERQVGSGAQIASVLLLLVCGVPLGAIFSVLGMAIYAALVNFTANALGGTGKFDLTVYLLSAINAPLSLIGSLLGLVPILGCLGIPIAFYSLYLQILAVKTVHKFDWGRAAASVLILVVLFGLILAVCAFALLIPIFSRAMRNSF